LTRPESDAPVAHARARRPSGKNPCAECADARNYRRGRLL